MNLNSRKRIWLIPCDDHINKFPVIKKRRHKDNMSNKTQYGMRTPCNLCFQCEKCRQPDFLNSWLLFYWHSVVTYSHPYSSTSFQTSKIPVIKLSMTSSVSKELFRTGSIIGSVYTTSVEFQSDPSAAPHLCSQVHFDTAHSLERWKNDTFSGNRIFFLFKGEGAGRTLN